MFLLFFPELRSPPHRYRAGLCTNTHTHTCSKMWPWPSAPISPAHVNCHTAPCREAEPLAAAAGSTAAAPMPRAARPPASSSCRCGGCRTVLRATALGCRSMGVALSASSPGFSTPWASAGGQWGLPPETSGCLGEGAHSRHQLCRSLLSTRRKPSRGTMSHSTRLAACAPFVLRFDRC